MGKQDAASIPSFPYPPKPHPHPTPPFPKKHLWR